MKASSDILGNFDFSSWFSFWHEHLDSAGKGNESWAIRMQYLNEMFLLYEKLNNEICKYHNKYQSWCWIEDNESGGDAVFLHTPNPNENNYPFLERVVEIGDLDKYQNIIEFVERNGFKWVRTENGFTVYKEGYGDTLIAL